MFTVTRRPKGGGNSPPSFVGKLDAGDVAPRRRIQGPFGDIDEAAKPLPVRLEAKRHADGGFRVALPENILDNNLDAKIKRQRDKDYVEGTRAQYPSSKQVGYLGYLLDNPGRYGMERFVRFANGYYMGEITRVHFVEAINMAIRGRNSYGTAVGLARLASGELEEDCLSPQDHRPKRQRQPKVGKPPKP